MINFAEKSDKIKNYSHIKIQDLTITYVASDFI
jgi:hypothetical protein